MNPEAILIAMRADGISLAISRTGNIAAKGDRQALGRWKHVLSEHKSELLDYLRRAARDSAEERAAIIEYDGGLSREAAEQLARRAPLAGSHRVH